jgi:hypothetical protein
MLRLGRGTVWPKSWWGERPRKQETERFARPAARQEGMCSADRLHIIVIAWVTLSWHICHGKPTPLWSNDGDLSN